MKNQYLTGNWWREADRLKKWNIEAYDDIPLEFITYLKEDIKKIPKAACNKTLAGHIKEEYSYKNWPISFENYLIQKIESSPILNEYTRKVNDLSENRPFYLHRLWCNFQKKYEFNPLHNHVGMFSFIIFLNIPYNLDEEDNYFPKTSATKPSTSRLCFLAHDTLNNIVNIDVNVDKSFQNKIVVFPAIQQHQVYPFFTSDDYRITVSGNIKLKAGKIK